MLGECSGTPQSADTWGGLLVITRKLGGTDGFGKHFCRVLLTEKKKGNLAYVNRQIIPEECPKI